MAEERKDEQLTLFDLDTRPVIKGFPELRWTGKRPYRQTQYYPAQLKERYGNPDKNRWINKIFWGDNLQVMSHLLKDYRGKIDLIYIDPPFDSKADYKKKIELRGKTATNDNNFFEEKQYGDIWTNDEYLQFMYERLILLRELLSDKGAILVHCDFRQSANLRLLLDEIFGGNTDVHFRNEIIWSYRTGGAPKDFSLSRKHDSILLYAKTSQFKINKLLERQYLEKPFMGSPQDSQGRWYVDTILRDTFEGVINVVVDKEKEVIKSYNTRAVLNLSAERVDYPTQKPEGLINILMDVCSNPGDLVFDCFMGSGTTQAIAMKNNRRFLGADINLGAVQTTTKRLLNIIKNTNLIEEEKIGFEVYNVNNYDFFRNPLEARDLLIEALQIQPFSQGSVFHGELDGRKVYILPVNRIATRVDLQPLTSNLPYKSYEKIQEKDPNAVVDRITLVCMGHEPDLKGSFLQMIGKFKIDVEIVDILKDKSQLEFKRDSQANIQFKHNILIIKSFYPMNLMQKLSIQKEEIDDWTQLVDSILIDYNYDGETLNPQITDVPGKNELVKGKYDIPKTHGRIKVKITDLLSESYEVEVIDNV
ncbi:dNA modification methylase [Firmicutes bacterium CAG:631]|nr:dNA modification methylase [Firmicutes bacterium CAG:631]